MKISEMIANLQEFMKAHGDLECYYATDDEGNAYHPVYYGPSCYYVNEDGEMYNEEDVLNEDPEDVEDLKPVCIVN